MVNTESQCVIGLLLLNPFKAPNALTEQVSGLLYVVSLSITHPGDWVVRVLGIFLRLVLGPTLTVLLIYVHRHSLH